MFFKGDVLDRFEGDAMPSEAEFVATLDNRRKRRGKVPPLEATEEQLKKFSAGKPRPPRPPAAPPHPPPATRRSSRAPACAGHDHGRRHSTQCRG